MSKGSAPDRRSSPHTLRSSGWTVRAVIAAILVSALAPVNVNASNFGSQCATTPPPWNIPTCVSLGNNNVHNYYFSSVEVNQRAAVNWASLNVYNPTDLHTSETVDSSANDVIVRDSTYGLNGIWGWVDCDSTCPKTGAHPNRTGQRQGLRFNLSYPNAFDTTFERRYMACHEFGHTVGLRHNGATSSCMYADVAVSNVLNSHDISHINAKY